MSRRAKIWLAIAIVFTLVNVGGAIYAAYLREGEHAGIHVVLAVVGAIMAWLIAARAQSTTVRAMPRTDGQLDNLQQSVDAIALEVERIGEAQRFSAKLQAERVEPKR